MMNSETFIDYAVFQLSPEHSRYELFVTWNGETEKLASGFFEPFISHLKVAEEQIARESTSIQLEVERLRNENSWFNKGTIERFVQFVCQPEVLESANAYDAEISQLEGARRIYSQASGDPLANSMGKVDSIVEAANVTMEEFLKATDMRLVSLKQDLATSCSRAVSAGFCDKSVSELLLFAEYFGANRLNNEAVIMMVNRTATVNNGDLSPNTKLILYKLKDVLLGNHNPIKKKSISFLLEKMFMCGSGFAPAPSLRDPIIESRMDKILRAILTKTICQHCSAPIPPKKYLENTPQEQAHKEVEECQRKSKSKSKWVKTDSEFIVLEI